MNLNRFKYLAWVGFFAALALIASLSLATPRWMMLTVVAVIGIGALIAVTSLIQTLRTAQEREDAMRDEITLLTAELEAKEERLIQQSRYAAMGEMIPTIAHQWRQPLTSISMIAGTLHLQAMLDQYDKNHFVDKLNSISDLAVDLSGAIGDFRHFPKEDRTKEP